MINPNLDRLFQIKNTFYANRTTTKPSMDNLILEPNLGHHEKEMMIIGDSKSDSKFTLNFRVTFININQTRKNDGFCYEDTK